MLGSFDWLDLEVDKTYQVESRSSLRLGGWLVIRGGVDESYTWYGVVLGDGMKAGRGGRSCCVFPGVGGRIV